jgi:2-methylcitrate dehydratase PrpD
MTVTTTTVTATLAQLVAGKFHYEDFGDDARYAARGILLDGVANMLAGSREPLATPLCGYLRQTSNGPCAVVGHDFRVGPCDAAFANAIFCHSMDYEMIALPPTHPTSPVLAPIMALSQIRKVSGQQALEALVAGIEVECAINIAIYSTKRWLFGLHEPGMVGPFGAAAASSKLIGLPGEKISMAFGIAGSRVSGLMANTGSMTKATHCGQAARGGLEAALLINEGYTANPDILGARWGFNQVYFNGNMDLSLILPGFGEDLRVVNPGLAVKKYPSQFPTHWSIDAAIDLIQTGNFSATEIDRVTVEVGADCESAQATELPTTGLAGKFNLRYPVAAALLDGTVGIDTFRDERLNSADMQDMLRRIDIVKMPDVKAMDFAAAWSRVTVTTKTGSVWSSRVDRPLGIWDRPLPWDYRLAKFRDCASRVYDESVVDGLIDEIEHFEDVNDVGAFVARLAPNADE